MRVHLQALQIVAETARRQATVLGVSDTLSRPRLDSLREQCPRDFDGNIGQRASRATFRNDPLGETLALDGRS
jgi:hypothetical protein